MYSAVDPGLDLRGRGRGLFWLPCWLFSLCNFFPLGPSPKSVTGIYINQISEIWKLSALSFRTINKSSATEEQKVVTRVKL